MDKIKIFLLLIIAGFLVVGCSNNEYKLTAEPAYRIDILELENKQDQRWEMLKEYLGVVEWTEKEVLCGIETGKENTYLTKDPLKVEWVKLECPGGEDWCQGKDGSYSAKNCSSNRIYTCVKLGKQIFK